MIYICIPTHNEQQTVGVVLWKLRQVLTDFPRDYQLLVADDASTDRTPDVLEPYTRVLPLTVIRCEKRQGHAASLEMLMREAVRRSEYPRRDAIVTMQADFTDEPDDIVPLIKRLEAGADVAVGNKVSSTRIPRGRRFARSLASFFARRQKWPEAVASPFDGYRAYRLQAVKKAMEERGDRRLVRYEGWAGAAELLRAVLPHARRVDAVNVEDRRDRLQRPSRERSLAAALQVRAMAAGVEPPALIGVPELDRIAQTASRSRQRTTLQPRTAQASTNGARTRDRRQRNGGQRARSNGGSPRNTERGGPRGRTQKEGAESRGRGRAEPAAEAAAPAGEEAPKQKRRRRRRRTGTAGSQEPRQEQATGEAPAAAEPEAAEAGEAAPPAERKRRRRGGRRGGRGRRRRSTANGGTADAGTASEPVAESAGPVTDE